MPQDKWHDTGIRLGDELAQGECAEARKVKPGEGQSRPGTNRFVAVQGGLSECVFRRGSDNSGRGVP